MTCLHQSDFQACRGLTRCSTWQFKLWTLLLGRNSCPGYHPLNFSDDLFVYVDTSWILLSRATQHPLAVGWIQVTLSATGEDTDTEKPETRLCYLCQGSVRFTAELIGVLTVVCHHRSHCHTVSHLAGCPQTPHSRGTAFPCTVCLPLKKSACIWFPSAVHSRSNFKFT